MGRSMRAVVAVALGLAGEGSAFSVSPGALPSRATPRHGVAASPACGRAPLGVAMAAKAKKSMFVDEAALLKEQGFARTPEDLIARAKTFLESRGGFGADPALMAEDFQFMGPVVGPLSKDAFVKAIGSVDMETAFPDFQGEFYAFSVDPFEGNRVWYIARGRGTNTGPLPPFAPAATNKPLENPPQACSLTFNEQGLVTKYTIWYVMDRTVGTTGGLGGLYGVLYSIGKPLPFPEARPWKMSKRYRVFNKVGNFLQGLKGKAADVETQKGSSSSKATAETTSAVDLSLLRGSGSVFEIIGAKQANGGAAASAGAASADSKPVIPAAGKSEKSVPVTLPSGKTVEVPVNSYERK